MGNPPHSSSSQTSHPSLGKAQLKLLLDSSQSQGSQMVKPAVIHSNIKNYLAREDLFLYQGEKSFLVYRACFLCEKLNESWYAGNFYG